MLNHLDWPYAWTKPQLRADLKTYFADFVVEEILGTEPSGHGEFVYLWIEKQGVNSEYLARRIAQFANVSLKQVSYAGTKDRHALTSQWFCIHLQHDIDFQPLETVFSEPEKIRVLRQERHHKKLKTGGHLGNRFLIRLRQLEGNQDELEQRLALIQQAGVPNYYGNQRFGIQGNNLVQGRAMVEAGRKNSRKLEKTESFWLSAMRSWCFNIALADQVQAGIWDKLFAGDIVQPQHAPQQQRIKQLDAMLLRRWQLGEIHPVLPLISDGWQLGASELRRKAMEHSYRDEQRLLQGLITFDFARDGRATRLMANDMAWELLPDDQLLLGFSLPKGAFATTLLRELCDLNDKSIEQHHEDSNLQ
ncbi:tRNA pseudouridine(13) synthase TruD [Maribrevibacterium harenarium]|uniref:tRNA pseudouridine synthase D n=1 Tax=Maribrevibacterium harenarium TaxID=2589817 RepID=A0A501WYX0_9GAMM|nr:tRNA pseudouridine(13) synthase TruD [Maribrevibacterium harenarium]TPE52807.1 tRNA pseudouridine(13) synthase TruD [Maribrevibacterium harenarium]